METKDANKRERLRQGKDRKRRTVTSEGFEKEKGLFEVIMDENFPALKKK